MQVRQRNWRQAAVMFRKDLSLFGSLCLARFIVWRSLRRRRKERAYRLERLRLVHKVGCDWRETTNT